MSKTKKTALIATAILASISAGLLFALPNIVASTFEKQATNLGINPDSLQNPEKKWNAIRYKNLKIGKNGDSTIDTVTLYFDAMTLANRTLQNIAINGLYVSGDIDINGNISVKGLNKPPALSSLNTIKTEQISIKNANFSFLSAHFGGLRGIINLSGQKEDNNFAWTGNIDSRQDQLEIIAKINAQTSNSGRWLMDMQIENAKLERSFGKFTRVNGTLNITGENRTLNALNAELSAGALNAYGTSWQNASITINNQTSSNKVYVSAKSSGIEGLELNIEAQPSYKSINWTSTIFSETGFKLTQYLKSQGMMPLSQNTLSAIADLKNITLQLKPTNNSLIFKINNEGQNIDIKGKIEKQNTQNYQGIFKISKGFSNGISDAKCKKATPDNAQICQINLVKKNRKFALNDPL